MLRNWVFSESLFFWLLKLWYWTVIIFQWEVIWQGLKTLGKEIRYTRKVWWMQHRLIGRLARPQCGWESALFTQMFISFHGTWEYWSLVAMCYKVNFPLNAFQGIASFSFWIHPPWYPYLFTLQASIAFDVLLPLGQKPLISLLHLLSCWISKIFTCNTIASRSHDEHNILINEWTVLRIKAYIF